MKEKEGESVKESEIKGIDELSRMEKKHLLAQLVRDRRNDPKAGPWEITNIRRGGWETIKDSLIQPVEIEMNDRGKEMFLRVWIDITDAERQFEVAAKRI